MSDCRAVLISGAPEHDSEESLLLLRDYLHVNAPVRCDLLSLHTGAEEASLAPIDDADVVILFACGLQTGGLELERFQRYCRAGRPLIGIRTAGQAFRNWPGLDAEILGGNHQGPLGEGGATAIRIAPAAAGHPVLFEVRPFPAHGPAYRNTPLATDCVPLLWGCSGNQEEPVAWICQRAGPVFTTSLGDQGDFWELDFLRLLENALRWQCSLGVAD